MVNPLHSTAQPVRLNPAIPIVDGKLVKNCHIRLPDYPKPVGAIIFGGKLYSYVRFYPTMDAAQRAAERSMSHGNLVVLTQVQKGLILWVLEPDAQLAGTLRQEPRR